VKGVGAVRIIAGTARGTKLDTIEGLNTRPTTDRVKENIFNMIQFEITGERVLDLFAGSGALGIEAASRGASEVILVESSVKCAKIIQSNIDKTRMNDKIRLFMKPVEQVLTSYKDQEPFHIIFMDPPYDKGFVIPTIESISDSNLLDETGMIVLEHRSDEVIPNDIKDFELSRTKKYGNTAISIFRRKS